MNGSIQLFFALLVTGMFLLGAEIYLPGGVVGVIGFMALVGAMVMGFAAFGPYLGFIVAVLIIVLTGLILIVWVRYFPKTGMGRKMTLEKDGKANKAAVDYRTLLDLEGEAVSDLRPAGIALIAGQRVDVVADGSYIPAHMKIKVTTVEGNRIMVRELSLPHPEKSSSA